MCRLGWLVLLARCNLHPKCYITRMDNQSSRVSFGENWLICKMFKPVHSVLKLDFTFKLLFKSPMTSALRRVSDPNPVNIRPDPKPWLQVWGHMDGLKNVGCYAYAIARVSEYIYLSKSLKCSIWWFENNVVTCR